MTDVENLFAKAISEIDRMLVAQALTEGLRLVTHDRAMAPYEADLLWA